ncbi:hypothetical protein A2U01_0110085, partial [Trifolium medium]|nr:hypothetical protein [Trifolium medium]
WRSAQAKLQEADFGSGLCATHSPGWRNAPSCMQVWLGHCRLRGAQRGLQGARARCLFIG